MLPKIKSNFAASSGIIFKDLQEMLKVIAAHGYTMNEIAKIIGVSRRVLARWFNDASQNIPKNTAFSCVLYLYCYIHVMNYKKTLERRKAYYGK